MVAPARQHACSQQQNNPQEHESPGLSLGGFEPTVGSCQERESIMWRVMVEGVIVSESCSDMIGIESEKEQG